jgi:capsular exopolysaccharide synthesis family protein
MNQNKKNQKDALNSPRPLHENLRFSAMEQYKLLRTNLSFVLPEDVKCPIIGVTSSAQGDGKSTTAINLSYVLAADKKRVLLIDGDMRLPSIARKMNLLGSYGLSNLLMTYDVEDMERFHSKILDGWYVLPAGSLPPNPSELLGSPKMQKLLNLLSEKFDYIILDLPPVNAVSDAIAVSRWITGMILVVRQNYTDKKDLENCVRQLTFSNVKVLGCVMNECDDGLPNSGKYKRYSKKYGYRTNYTKDQKKQKAGKSEAVKRPPAV